MLSSASSCRFDSRDVDFFHLHHRFEGALGCRAIRIGDGIGEGTWRDLPRQAPFVLAPAACAFLAAVFDNRVPQAIGFGLVVGRKLEREGLVVPALRAAAYKSGTSMLCQSIEAQGYGNPCRLTNAGELGRGIATDRYLTRECSVARAFNRRLVNAGPLEAAMIESELAAYLVEMAAELGPRLVLKDPYMKLTAVHWVRAANSLGAAKLSFLETDRDPAAIRRSLAGSRFLTAQEQRKPEEFRRLLLPTFPILRTSLAALSVEHRVVRYCANS